MFNDFTLQARYVLAYALQQAQHRHHETIDTEHVLLAIIWETTGVGADVLRDVGIDYNQVFCAASRRTAGGTRHISLDGKPMSKAVLDTITFARDEACKLGHQLVGTGHLLLGLLHESESTAVQVLHEIGKKAAEVRKATLKALATANDTSAPLIDRRPQEGWAHLDKVLFRRLEGVAAKRKTELNELLHRVVEEWLNRQA